MVKPRLIVLGLGNVLCSDDGLGVEAVRRLERDFLLPPEVEVLDGGTLGMTLMRWIAHAPALLLVDAVMADGAAVGSLVRLEGLHQVSAAVRERLSVHQVGVADLLDGLRLIDAEPGELTLLGLVPASLELGIEPSPAVAAGLPGLVEAVAAEIATLGYAVARRSPDENLAVPVEELGHAFGFGSL